MKMRRVGLVAVVVLVLSACSKDVQTERALDAGDPQSSPPVDTVPITPELDNNNNYQYQYPPSNLQIPGYDSYNYYYPQTNYYSTYNCTGYRSGGYYQVGQDIDYWFYGPNNESVEIYDFAATDFPYYQNIQPLLTNAYITYYSPGEKWIGFRVRSASNPSQLCFGGAWIWDRVMVNGGYGYNY